MSYRCLRFVTKPHLSLVRDIVGLCWHGAVSDVSVGILYVGITSQLVTFLLIYLLHKLLDANSTCGRENNGRITRNENKMSKIDSSLSKLALNI
uniref:Uncharacterized protein n=1 Tax=Strigamia maritima TaxID=126957 RepID=T1JNN0_STRMM